MMELLTYRSGRIAAIAVPLVLGTVFMVGCASPGPPRAPSLHLPQVVTDLRAHRVGDEVELQFAVPRLSTDKLPLYNAKERDQVLHGTLCRQVDRHDCVAIAGIAVPLTARDQATDQQVMTLHDVLPASLRTGSPHLLGYRVEFYNAEGRSAGRSEAALTATGPIPAPVVGLRVAGSRGGALLQWDPAGGGEGEVLLQRTELNPKVKPQKAPAAEKPMGRKVRATGAGKLPAAHDEVEQMWLKANSTSSETLDDGITAGEPYRYVAVRRMIVAVGAETFDLRSLPSEPVAFTLQPVYAPAMPTGLTATGFSVGDAPAAGFAVDLIWQPVDDARVTKQLAAPLVGYNVYREELAADGIVYASRVRLNEAAVALPAFHDATAKATSRYRYSVTAIDGNGNESKAATFTLEPSPQ